MEIFLVWIIFSVLVGVYASSKGHHGPRYFLVSILLSPLIGFIIAAVQKPDRAYVAKKSGQKKCPRCAEFVQGEALVCRYCGHNFPANSGGIVLEE